MIFVQGHYLLALDGTGYFSSNEIHCESCLDKHHRECWETVKGKVQHFSWVTDLRVNKGTVYRIMEGARARWRLANETFNTLKNQGYYFEHNFGHGYEHLSVVFAELMMLAFLVDQVQQLCCPLFQAAWVKWGTNWLPESLSDVGRIGSLG